MARKTLLTEGELRRFMKLANMRPLGEEKIQEMYGDVPGGRDDEDLDEEISLDEEEMEMDMEMGAEEEPMDDMDMGAEDDLGEPDPMDEPVDDAPEGEMELSDEEAQAIIDLADRLQAAMGADAGGEDDMDMSDDLGAEDDLEAPEGGDELEMDAEEEEEPMMEEDDLVAEVAKRVAARLQAENKKQEIVDQLAERIMKRLTK